MVFSGPPPSQHNHHIPVDDRTQRQKQRLREKLHQRHNSHSKDFYPMNHVPSSPPRRKGKGLGPPGSTTPGKSPPPFLVPFLVGKFSGNTTKSHPESLVETTIFCASLANASCPLVRKHQWKCFEVHIVDISFHCSVQVFCDASLSVCVLQ